MSIFDRFRGGKTKSASTKESIAPIAIDTWKYRGFSGDILTYDLIVDSISALARNIGKMDLKSVRRNAENVATVDRVSDIAKVLAKPNKYMTQYDFLYKVASLYYSSNNVFIWPERDEKGNLVALWPVNYKNFRLVKAENGVLIAEFQLAYTKTYYCAYDELIHLRNHYTTDDLFGDNNAAINPVAELIGAQRQGIINGIKNSAVIRGILKSLNVLKKTDMDAAREQFIEDNLQASNNGGVMVIDGKFDYQNIESKPYVIDSETREQTKKEVYEYFGVNEAFVTNSYTPEQYDAVYEGALEPFARMLMQAFTSKLFTEREQGFGDKVEVNMRSLKFQTTSAAVSIINATRELGLFRRDEYREMLGYEPLGTENGGDEIMVAINNYSSDTESNNEENNDGE